MKLSSFLFCAAAALGLSGCFSLEAERVKPSNGEHVVVSNFGWQLFNSIPLVCGNADEESSVACVFFRDDVTMETLQRRLVDYANGRKIDCPVWNPRDQCFITVFNIPIPYILTYKKYTISGTLR